MAILSFWSGSKKETGQTLSLVAIATYMSVEHNYKTLVIDATFDDDTIQKCFWNSNSSKEIKKELTRGKLDITSGTEGLMTAIASNKTSPEIISSYTKVVFKNRLDILLGLKTKSLTDHEKTLGLYTDLIKSANQYYDLVIVDLSKTAERESTHKILQMSDVIMYTMGQNLGHINEYMINKSTMPELAKKHVIPLIGSMNGFCKYNPKNVNTMLKDKNLSYIIYNHVFLEAACEAKVADFFLSTRINKKVWDRNSQFLISVEETSKKVIQKFEEIKYGRAINSQE